MMNQHFVLVLSAVQLILASGQADTELKSSCLLQTGAAREQPLAMNHGEDVVSRPEYLRNALVMVRELASNVTAWDTDLSQSERNSLDVIKQFITDLFQSAANSHDEDQREVNRARDLIGDCASTAKTSLTNDVQPLKNIMQGSRQDHNTCRTSEGGCQTHQNQACAEWEAYRKSNTPTECAGVAFKAHMGTQVESTKLDMEQCLRDLQPYYLKHIPCWQYKGCVDGFAPLCDDNQTKFERDFCGYSNQLSHTCQTQIDCRQKHIAFRDDTHADVGVNEAARKADYATGKKVLCYFGVFEANNPNKSAILRGCDKLAVDTSKLDITYPGTPAAHPCVVEAEEPCSNGWVAAEYNTKKWLKHVTLLDCEPCVKPTPAPTPPPKVISGVPTNFKCTDDGTLCYVKGPNTANAHQAIAHCTKLEARVCTHGDMQELCGNGMNPYEGVGSGWYGDHGTSSGGNWDDEYGTWNVGSCQSNNDGPALHSGSQKAFRCCKSGTLPTGATVVCPPDMQATHTQNGEICGSVVHGSLNMHEAIGKCRGHGGHVCLHNDMQQLCAQGNPYENKVPGWYGDHGKVPGANWDDEFGTWNGGSCGSNNDGQPRHANERLPFKCCARSTAVNMAGTIMARTCDDGFAQFGGLCYRDPKVKKNMHDAIKTCWGFKAHVCEHVEMQTVCGLGGNPYTNPDNGHAGWYGDHATAGGGNWDDEFGTWNSASCGTNNDGPARHSNEQLYFRCCKRAR